MIDLKLLINSNSKLSLRLQFECLGLPLSSYYLPKGESKENLEIMMLMDKHIMQEPTAGILTMQSMLSDQAIEASYERIRRLIRKAGPNSILFKPLSRKEL